MCMQYGSAEPASLSEPSMTGRMSGFKWQCIANCHQFLVFFLNFEVGNTLMVIRLLGLYKRTLNPYTSYRFVNTESRTIYTVM